MTGYIYALITALLTAAIYLLTPVARAELSALSTMTLTISLAFLALSMPLLRRRKLRRKIGRTPAKGWIWTVIIAALTGFGYYLFYSAIPLLDTTVASFLHRAETLVTIAFGVLLLGERFRRFELLGGLLVLVGVVVVKYVGDLSVSEGFFMIMASSLIWGILEGLAKIAVRYMDPYVFTWARSGVLTLGLAVFCVVTGARIELPRSEGAVLGIIGLALSGPVLARYCYMQALARLPVSHVALISQTLPVMVAALALTFTGVLPTARELGGGSLIVLGCLMLVGRKRS